MMEVLEFGEVDDGTEVVDSALALRLEDVHH